MAFQPAEATRTTAENASDRVGPTVMPRVLKRVKASYTPAARAARVNDNVRVNITIDERGEVIRAKVISGHELLKLPSLRAARQCLFAPALRDGVPVKMDISLEFTFSIY